MKPRLNASRRVSGYYGPLGWLKSLLERSWAGFWAYFEGPPGQVRPRSCKRGEHQFRTIAPPYVKQCRIKSCGFVAYDYGAVGEFPDGLGEYVELMTAGIPPVAADFPHSYRPDEALRVNEYQVLPCRVCGGPRDFERHVRDAPGRD